MATPRFKLHTLAACLSLGALCLAGCYYPGGPGASLDLYTYESTTWMPQTVTLVDTRNGQTLWSVDVPVGKELVVQFVPGKGTTDNLTPDQMKWELFALGTTSGDLNNSVAVPASWCRRVDVKLRPTPELPEEMLATPAPVKQPVIETMPPPSGPK